MSVHTFVLLLVGVHTPSPFEHPVPGRLHSLQELQQRAAYPWPQCRRLGRPEWSVYPCFRGREGYSRYFTWPPENGLLTSRVCTNLPAGKESAVVPKWCPTLQNYLMRSHDTKNAGYAKILMSCGFAGNLTRSYVTIFWEGRGRILF